MNNNIHTLRTLAALALALTLPLTAAPARAQATETEPNDSKATANLVTLANGGTITGSTQGVATSGGGALSVDYYRIRTAPAAAGIYRHVLQFTPANQVGGNYFTNMRGLQQSNSVILTTTDPIFQTASSSLAPVRALAWYGFGKEESIVMSISGSSFTPGSYTGTLTSTSVTPQPITGTIFSGDITIRCTGGVPPAMTDSEIWLFDSSFTALPLGSNDNKDAALSRMTRSLAPGVYYLAVAETNIATSQASSLDDNSRSTNVLDFPDAIARASVPTFARNYVITISSPGAPDVTATGTNALVFGDIQWHTVTVQAAPSCLPGKTTAIATAAAFEATSFSTPVALSGNTLIIGNPLDDTAFGANAGSVSVYIRSGSNWVVQSKIDFAAAANEQAGSAVAIDGDTVIAGGPSNAGAYSLTRSGSVWTQNQYFVAADFVAGTQFGAAVAISGNTAVIGAPLADAPGVDSGAVYVFTRTGITGAWTQQAKIVGLDTAADDRFGTSVAISGNTLVVGSPQNEVSLANAGAAYVFVRIGGVWVQQAKLLPSDPGAGDNFGSSVSISGDSVLVGSPNDVSPATLAGSAYIFSRSGAAWTQQAKLVAADQGTSDNFGTSVSISGNTAIVGAPNDDTGSFSNNGSVYVFSRIGSAWTQSSKVDPPDIVSFGQFGLRVGVDGPVAIVGGTRPGGSGNVANVLDGLAPGIDGFTDACYGGAIAYQSSQTSAGSSTAGNAELAEGSELYSMHARIMDGVLYIALTGNLESTNGKLELFFDTGAGGQNTLRSNNPNIAAGGLLRMAGLTFDSGFSPDHYITIAGGSFPALRQVEYAALPTLGGGIGRFLGYIDYTDDGSLAGGSNPDNIRVAINNSNTGGVAAGTGMTLLPAVSITTGVELAIPLSALGGVTCDIKVLAFMNTESHAAATNQFLPTIPPGAALGDPRFINLANIFGAQFASVSNAASFSSQPLDANACETGNVSFAVSAVNALTYQWRRNGANLANGGNISGATSPALSLVNVSAANAGLYDCLITTACGVPLASNAANLAVSVNYSGATDPFSIVPGDAASGDVFGLGVTTSAISGDTLVIGAQQDDTPGGVDAGSVSVYVRNGTSWTLQQKLTASDGAAGDGFGTSWAIDGDYIIVGSPSDDTPAGPNAGSAYIFFRNAGVWSQQQKIEPAVPGTNDAFGSSVGISGSRVVVGAPLNDLSFTDQGSVHVFVRSGVTWTQEGGNIVAADPAASDQLGNSVAISGDTIVAGAPGEGNVVIVDTNEGAVYVFVRVGTTWPQQQKLVANPRTDGDFGGFVALSGDDLLYGVPFRDDVGTDSGAVYYFARSGVTWTQRQRLASSDVASGDQFGRSIFISGNRAIISSHLADAGATDAGAAYIFTLSGGQWAQDSKLTSPTFASGDLFGSCVGLNGDIAVVGAFGDDYSTFTNAGSAQVHYLRPWVESVSVATGGVANFPIVFNAPGVGANVSFQWRKNGVNLANGATGTGSTVSGATTATLTISSVSAADAATYDCLFVNPCKVTLSHAASLTVTAPIFASPNVARACRGQRTAFVAGDVGSNMPDLRWEFQNPALGDAWTPVNVGAFSSGPVRGSITCSPDHRELWWEGDWSATAPAELRFRCVCASNPDATPSTPGTLVICPADFNCSGAVSPQDVFDFLSAWFTLEPTADINADAAVSVQDVFDFLSIWFSGCGGG